MMWVLAACVALVGYAYLGYPALLWVLARFRSKPIEKALYLPTISVVMAVHNGAQHLAAKLQNLRASDYPADKVQICVASDGSTDETENILESALPAVKWTRCPRLGKAAALNEAIRLCSGDVVVFTDVRQEIEGSAVRELTADFADPTIGCVSGELMLRSGGENIAGGVSLYWRLEKAIRKLESKTGSVVGATGAIYAVRRVLVPTVPAGTLLDDVYIPLAVVAQGQRVVFEPAARAWDDPAANAVQEFRRKVRTLAGNYQLLQIAPRLCADPRIVLRFFSHKLLRLLVPWLLVGMLASSWALASIRVFLVLAILQSAAYALAISGLLWKAAQRIPLVSSASAFVVLNTAAAVGLFSFLRHRNEPTRIWSGGPRVAEEAQPVTANAKRAG